MNREGLRSWCSASLTRAFRAGLLVVLSCFCPFPAHAQQTVDEWQKKVVTDFPQIGVKGSESNLEFVRRVQSLRSTNPAFFNDPRWPYTIAEQLAKPSVIPGLDQSSSSTVPPNSGASASAPVSATPSVAPTVPTSSIDESRLNAKQQAGVRWLELPPPQLTLSTELKRLGFNASFRFTEPQKELIQLSAAKDIAGIVRNLNGKDYSKPPDLDRAILNAESVRQRFIVAVQSDSIITQSKEFQIKGDPLHNASWISVLLFPADLEKPFILQADGHLSVNVYYHSGKGSNFELHPAGDGFLYQAPRGAHTVNFFFDWTSFRNSDGSWRSSRGPGNEINYALNTFKDDIEKLNKQRDLGELSPEQLIQNGHARYKVFMDAIRPSIQ